MRLGWIIVFVCALLPGKSFLQVPCEDIGITEPLGFNMVFDVPGDGIIDPGDQFCVDFTVENFDFVIGWQFTFAFDPTILNYLSYQTCPGVLLGPVGPNDFQTDRGVLSLVWTNLNAEGQTLPDGTKIFTICFEAIGEPNDCSPIYFNDDYPFFPELEVNYQIDENTTCSDTLLLLDGEESTSIKIECTDLTIINIQACNATSSNGTLGFSACGGALPYSYAVSNSANPVVLTGTIDMDGEEVFFPNVPVAVYTILITDALGNTATRNINIESAPPLQYDTSLEEPNCPEAQTGVIKILDIRGGVPGISGYTMAASTGQFFQNTFGDSLVRLSNGTYTITITDDAGCEEVETFVLNTPEIELMIEVDTASCFMATDGRVHVVPSGGTPFPGGEYRINGQLSTEFETDMPFQHPNYFDIDDRLVVRIEDANGCRVEERIAIPVRDRIDADILELIDVPCMGDDSGSARIRVNSPGRYNFLLTDEIGNFVPAVGSVIDNRELFYNMTLPAGFYNLRIRETTLGCELDTFFIINEPDEELVITTGSVAPDCNSANGVAFVNAEGGMAPYSYAWSFNPMVTGDSLTGLLPGLYNVTVTDDLGCAMEAMVEVDQGGQLDAQIEILSSLECDGTGQGSLNAELLENTFPDVYVTWTDASGNLLGSDAILEFTAPGTFILTVSDTGNSCMDSDTVFIDPAGIFTFDITVMDASCPGASDGAALVGNFQGGIGPYSCEWEDNTISSCDPQNLEAGIYNLTVSDDAGCRIDTFFEIFNTASEITFNIDATDPSCVDAIDGVISFTDFSGGTGPYDCMWEDPDITGCPRTGLPAGSYPVTITDAAGCATDTVIQLISPEAIEISILAADISDVSCFGENDGGAIVSITNDPSGAGSYNFSWSNPADDNSGGLTDEASQLSGGLNYVIAFDDNSCASDTLFFEVGEPDILVLDRDNSMIISPTCMGECDGRVELAATGGTLNGGAYRFLWEDGSTLQNRTGLCPGTYMITVIDDNNCETEDSIVIMEPEALIVDIDPNGTVDLNCFGDDSGAIQISASGGCGGFIYEWPGNVSDSERAENLGEGSYTITVTDNCGCSAETSYTLEASAPIIADLIDTDMPDCFGGTTCIGIENVTGGVGNNYTFSINFGERLPIDSCVEVIAGLYNITVFDSVGCAESLLLEVEQPDMLSVDLGPDLELDLGDSTAMITADIMSANPVDSIIWSSTGGNFSCQSDNCESILISTNTFTTYEVMVVDNNGCTGKDDINVSISAQRNVYIPNIFNPEAFPPNNKFMILTGAGVESLEYLRIFDRWGNLIYEVEGLSHPTSIDDGWNGRYNNKEVEQGVYVFVAAVRFVDGREILYRGDLTLVR